MLILNDDHRLRAGVTSMTERCPYCSKALTEYPLIMNDDTEQTVYHVACAIQLATDIMVDLYTFFSPPAPYDRLFVLCPLGVREHFQSLMELPPLHMTALPPCHDKNT